MPVQARNRQQQANRQLPLFNPRPPLPRWSDLGQRASTEVVTALAAILAGHDERRPRNEEGGADDE